MDKYIRTLLKEWKKEAGVKGICQFKYNRMENRLTIYTPFPGWFIGKGGLLYDKYKKHLTHLIPKLEHIDFAETSLFTF